VGDFGRYGLTLEAAAQIASDQRSGAIPMFDNRLPHTPPNSLRRLPSRPCRNLRGKSADLKNTIPRVDTLTRPETEHRRGRARALAALVHWFRGGDDLLAAACGGAAGHLIRRTPRFCYVL
jgi:hypothetical protein